MLITDLAHLLFSHFFIAFSFPYLLFLYSTPIKDSFLLKIYNFLYFIIMQRLSSSFTDHIFEKEYFYIFYKIGIKNRRIIGSKERIKNHWKSLNRLMSYATFLCWSSANFLAFWIAFLLLKLTQWWFYLFCPYKNEVGISR